MNCLDHAGFVETPQVDCAAIASLDEVDRLLAQTAIDDAVAEVSTAQEEMTDARGSLAKRRLDLATTTRSPLGAR